MVSHRVNLWGGTQLCSTIIWWRGDGIVRRKGHFFHHLFFCGILFERDQSHSSPPTVCTITHHRSMTFKCLPPFTSGGHGDIRDSSTPHPVSSVLSLYYLSSSTKWGRHEFNIFSEFYLEPHMIPNKKFTSVWNKMKYPCRFYEIQLFCNN